MSLPFGAMVFLLALLVGASRAAGERMLPGSGDLQFSLPAEAVIPAVRCADIAVELDRPPDAAPGEGAPRAGGRSAGGGMAAFQTLRAQQRLFLRHCLRPPACPAFRRETLEELVRTGEGSYAEAWTKVKALCGQF